MVYKNIYFIRTIQKKGNKRWEKERKKKTIKNEVNRLLKEILTA